MKTAIVYASVHHKNTEKLVQAITAKYPDVELIDATKTVLKDLSSRSFILKLRQGKIILSIIASKIWSCPRFTKTGNLIISNT